MVNFGPESAALQAKNPELKPSQFYVFHSFYMDDGLYSTRSRDEAITLLSRAREMLGEYKIRLHKLNSNSPLVLKAFPSSEVMASVELADLSPLSVSHALGFEWDVGSDTFSPNFSTQVRPFTKRGILATVNAIAYDPARLISPVILVGKLFQGEILPPKKSGSELVAYEWDDPLPKTPS